MRWVTHPSQRHRPLSTFFSACLLWLSPRILCQFLLFLTVKMSVTSTFSLYCPDLSSKSFQRDLTWPFCECDAQLAQTEHMCGRWADGWLVIHFLHCVLQDNGENVQNPVRNAPTCSLPWHCKSDEDEREQEIRFPSAAGSTSDDFCASRNFYDDTLGSISNRDCTYSRESSDSGVEMDGSSPLVGVAFSLTSMYCLIPVHALSVRYIYKGQPFF